MGLDALGTTVSFLKLSLNLDDLTKVTPHGEGKNRFSLSFEFAFRFVTHAGGWLIPPCLTLLPSDVVNPMEMLIKKPREVVSKLISCHHKYFKADVCLRADQSIKGNPLFYNVAHSILLQVCKNS